MEDEDTITFEMELPEKFVEAKVKDVFIETIKKQDGEFRKVAVNFVTKKKVYRMVMPADMFHGLAKMFNEISANDVVECDGYRIKGE